MLVIRPEQMARFSDYVSENFRRRMVVHLRSHFPERFDGVTDDQLRAFICQGMEKAEGHGVVDEEGVRLYLECVVMRGADFDLEPWAEDILESGLSGSAKMDRIAQHLVFSDPSAG